MDRDRLVLLFNLLFTVTLFYCHIFHFTLNRGTNPILCGTPAKGFLEAHSISKHIIS